MCTSVVDNDVLLADSGTRASPCVVLLCLTLKYQFSYNCNEVKQSIPAKEETVTNHISGIQECTSSDCIFVCAIGCFDFSLPTDECSIASCWTACRVTTFIGCAFLTPSMIGVTLLGWSSFEFDTIQGNG